MYYYGIWTNIISHKIGRMEGRGDEGITSVATLNPEHQDQWSIMASSEVHFPLTGWRASPFGAMKEPIPY
jgi:hypothetical protein